MEIRATLNNAFNTVQYAGVGTVEDQPAIWASDIGGTDADISVSGAIQVLAYARGWPDRRVSSRL